MTKGVWQFVKSSQRVFINDLRSLVGLKWEHWFRQAHCSYVECETEEGTLMKFNKYLLSTYWMPGSILRSKHLINTLD
jgi:hypothetical protein